MSRTGASSTSHKKIFNGVGKLYLNFKSFAEPGTLLGATRGGITANFNNTLRGIEFDGSQGDTKGLKVKDKFNPEITTTVIEMTKEKLNTYIAGSILDGQEITGGRITDDSYIDNVTFVGVRQDGVTFFQVELFNCLITPGALTMSDNNEVTLELTIRGHYEEGEMFTNEDCFPMFPARITIGEPFLDELSSVVTVDNAFASLVEADDGIIYGIPRNGENIFKFDPTDDSISYFAHGLTTTNNIFRSAIKSSLNGKIYCIPREHTAVVVIDPSDDSITEITIPGITADDYYSVSEGSNNKLYCTPYNADHVLIIDPTDNSVDTTTITGFTGSALYASSLAVGNKIYAAPSAATSVLIIDVDAETADTTTIDLGVGANKFEGMVLSTFGKIYCAPQAADYVLVINPVTDKKDIELMDGLTTTAEGDKRYSAAIKGDNGKIYCIPSNDNNVGIIDPLLNQIDQSIITKTLEVNFGMSAIKHTNGNIYIVSQVSGNYKIWKIA